jgi:predicted restriction endonuclease
MNRYQKAAKVSNDKSRERALKNYYENPKFCKECGKVIEVKEHEMCSEVRKKTYCDRSCSATYNNKVRERNLKDKKNKVVKEKKPTFGYLEGVTKKEFFDLKGVYYKFRAVIRRHAHYIYHQNNGEKKCKVCGYENHVEVCHIKSVSSFGNNDLITDINSFNNLIGLCPNHHWEFDNGIINIAQ